MLNVLVREIWTDRGQLLGDVLDERRFISFPPMGNGCEIGTVCFHQHSIQRCLLGDIPQHRGILERQNPGKQTWKQGVALAHGVSITDACLGWDDTAALLNELAESIVARPA